MRQKPIYLQLADRINRQIVSYELKTGEKLPSVREMAIKYSVNPNTIQRTYSELEREGIRYYRVVHMGGDCYVAW